MGQLTEREKRAIIARDKPGHDIVVGSELTDVSDSAEQGPASQSPDLSVLRSKFAGSRSDGALQAFAQTGSAGADLSELRRTFLGTSESSRDAAAPVPSSAKGRVAARRNQNPDFGAQSLVPDLDVSPVGEDQGAIVPVRRTGSPRDPYDGVAQQAKGVVISGSKKRVIGEQG